jgi:glycerate kinase
VKVVVAPNPFKGSLGAPDAAQAMASGVRDASPMAEVIEVPVADGGEGTVEALVAAGGGERVTITVEGPLGEPVEANFGLLDEGRIAVVELAEASGLPLVPEGQRNPRLTSTYGFGQLLEEARQRGVQRIIAGIGGSATNDAGAGMAQALGFHLLDPFGRELSRGGAALAQLAEVDSRDVDPGWRRVQVEVAVDVTNPLCGPTGASAIYGPQKGATPDMVQELDLALSQLAEVIGWDVAQTPGAGGAGGTGAGLIHFLGAKLRPGAGLVVEAAGLDQALEGAGVVMTGEGRVDVQSTYGKGPIEVARRAQAKGVPVILVAGSLGEGWEGVLTEGVTLVEPLIRKGDHSLSEKEMMVYAYQLLRSAAARSIHDWLESYKWGSN